MSVLMTGRAGRDFRKVASGPNTEPAQFISPVWGSYYIQGDGRTFLGHFKRHFGPQISSESLKQGRF